MPSHLHRIMFLLAGALGACSPPKIAPANKGTGAAGGTGGAASTGGAGGFGFDLDALGAGTDAVSSAPVPGGRGGDLPSCAAESHQAQLVPVDLLLLVDTSGSMNESAGMQSKWQLARATLGTFWKDPRSAGLGMGLQFFPLAGDDRTCAADADCTGTGVIDPGVCRIRTVCAGATLTLPARTCDVADAFCPAGTTCTAVGRCAVSGGDCLKPGTPCPTGAAGDMCMPRGKICGNIGSGSCTQADYSSLAVGITPLPAAEPALTRAITIKEPIGFTPTTPAVTGALDHLRQHLAANPTHKGALVILTDGLPLGCTQNTYLTVTSSIMAARMATPSILTYAIGVFGANQLNGGNTLDQWAMAGGTGTATVVNPTADFAEKLLAALNTVRGAALPCEFTIPPPQSGTIDFGKVNVRYSGAAGPTDVLYVGQASRCDAASGGWYYDVDPAMGQPTRILICPATCDRFKGDAAARVDLVFGCATKVIL
jgi:hypothetical protein